MNLRLSAPERLARLLSVLPWVVGQGGALIDDIATRFDYPREQLLNDLRDVVFFVGVHPFTPDSMIDVDIADEFVTIRYADWFSRPLRLSPSEGARLLTAGRTMLALGQDDDDNGPLLRALTKLGLSLGTASESAIDVRLGDAPDETLALVRSAVDSSQQVNIEYYSYGRDELTTRVVDAQRVFSDRGHWYLGGYCHSAEAERVFRVDRIRHIELAGAAVKPVSPQDNSAAREATPIGFVPDGDDPRVELLLDPRASWVAEQYPTESVSVDPDGRSRVVLAVSARAWLERMLVRLGPQAEILRADPPLDAHLVVETANRILVRYRNK